MAWLRGKRKVGGSPGKKTGADWSRCTACGEIVHAGELARNLQVCPKCSHHSRMPARERLRGILDEAVICGEGSVEGNRALFAFFEMAFMGGSMGSVVGEKVTRVIEEMIETELPPDLQRSETLLRNGLIDRVVDRRKLRPTLARLLALLVPPPAPVRTA
ncbi:MAG: hypothetical protein Q8R92_00820 [Deltaproteobacteria bacterium]|nr:hypothetical protein [Deltaproteobacteria bacterium]